MNIYINWTLPSLKELEKILDTVPRKFGDKEIGVENIYMTQETYNEFTKFFAPDIEIKYFRGVPIIVQDFKVGS